METDNNKSSSELFLLQFMKSVSSQHQVHQAPKCTKEIPLVHSCKRGGIHNISRPVLLAISHCRKMFHLVLRSAGKPIPSTVHNPKRVDLVGGCSVLYCSARPVIRALPTVSNPSINNRSQQQFQ